MIPPRYCYHVRLRFRLGMNPSVTTVYVAFTETEAYRWIDERNYPATYIVYVKEVAPPVAPEPVALAAQDTLWGEGEG